MNYQRSDKPGAQMSDNQAIA